MRLQGFFLLFSHYNMTRADNKTITLPNPPKMAAFAENRASPQSATPCFAKLNKSIPI
jgi:hypothetical protein